jgi:predicted enzyme related to lactoylglutathione lyase
MTNANQVKTLKAHLALNVHDVDRSIQFYKKMLGIEPSKVRNGYAKFDVQNPPLNLTLNEHSFGERGALSHLGIQVAATDDVLTMRRHWEQAGLITRDEMQTACCYALQDKTSAIQMANEWEVFVVLEDNLAETTSVNVGRRFRDTTKTSVPVISDIMPRQCPLGIAPYEPELSAERLLEAVGNESVIGSSCRFRNYG